MNLFEIFSVAIALAMDAFAVSVACGVSSQRLPTKNALVVATFFGGFQAFMPIIGWNVSSFAYEHIKDYDHWIAFIMLIAVGAKMIWDSLKDDQNDEKNCFANPLNLPMLLLLAIATSIDALAVGVGFACINQSISMPAFIIGIVAFILSFLGLKFGSKIGDKFNGKFEILGGVVLILIGFKILFTC